MSASTGRSIYGRKSKRKVVKKNRLKKKQVKSGKISVASIALFSIMLYGAYYYGRVNGINEKKNGEMSCESKLFESKPNDVSSTPNHHKKKSSPKSKQRRPKITNSYDARFRKKLEKYDRLIHKNPKEALTQFNALLEEYPDSPRASYGQANTLNELGARMRSNAYLDHAIFAYEAASKKINIPLELRRRIHSEWSECAELRGQKDIAVLALEQLLTYSPNDVGLLNRLGIIYLKRGANDHAKMYLQRSLNINPENGTALVYMGYIINQIEKNLNESIPYFERGMMTSEPATKHWRFYTAWGKAYIRTGKYYRAKKVFEDGAMLGIYPSAMQRSFYNSNIPSKTQPWWTISETPYKENMRLIEKNWKVILNEALSILGMVGMFLPEVEDLQHTGDWKEFKLFENGRKHQENCIIAPKTCALFDKIKDASICRRGEIKFSAMIPGTHVWPHTSYTNSRLRAHLGLNIPDGVYIRVVDDTRTWENGKLIIFDDSFEHEVWHNGTGVRLILIMDFWHPDLSYQQKRKLTSIETYPFIGDKG